LPDRSQNNGERGRQRPWHLAAILGAALLLGAFSAHAAKAGDRSKQKRAAESERAQLQQKLDALKRDIQKTETARDKAADELAKSEQAISETNRRLFELAEEQRQTEATLAELSAQQSQLNQSVSAQRQQLERMLREQYMSGGEDRVKLLLSGDDPNRISRELRYLSYVSKAQAQMIDTLRVKLRDVETNKSETQNAKDELDAIAEETRTQRAALEQEKAKRTALLAQLSGKLAAQRKEAGKIQRDEQRLSSLVDKLTKLIEQQQREEAMRAAQRKAHRPKHAAKQTNKKNDSDSAPEKFTGRNELSPEPSVQPGGNSTPFASLRGRLRLPVRGELAAKFGAKREDGPAWKGLFIRAAEGAEVKAVAAGRVVFADWLRGFGNLIIVDHGDQYLTIYGYNQAVLKHAGDTVKAGDVIATAGNSGGNAQSGLYFEMRHQGRAFDPLEWVVR
jgi:septal ring factor EnvC (AmiA/AmiB activator)